MSRNASPTGWVHLFLVSGFGLAGLMGILYCNSKLAVHDEQIHTIRETTSEIKVNVKDGFDAVNRRLDGVLQDRTTRVVARPTYGPPLP